MITGSRLCKVSSHIKSSFLTVQLYFKQKYCLCVFKKQAKKKTPNPQTGTGRDIYMGLNKEIVVWLYRGNEYILYIFIYFSTAYGHM